MRRHARVDPRTILTVFVVAIFGLLAPARGARGAPPGARRAPPGAGLPPVEPRCEVWVGELAQEETRHPVALWLAPGSAGATSLAGKYGYLRVGKRIPLAGCRAGPTIVIEERGAAQGLRLPVTGTRLSLTTMPVLWGRSREPVVERIALSRFSSLTNVGTRRACTPGQRVGGWSPSSWPLKSFSRRCQAG
jgi:hypothetical protein